MGFQDESGVIRWKLHFRSAPEAVYDALATNEGRAKYWAESADETDGVIEFRFVDYEPYRGRVLRREPSRAFAVDYFGAVTTFVLEPDGRGGTDLELIAEGVDESMRIEMIAGWISVLMAMKASVDFGVDLRNHDEQRTWQRGYADN